MAPNTRSDALRLFDSYHCSRYNTNTGVLTPAMFEAVFARVRDYLSLTSASAWQHVEDDDCILLRLRHRIAQHADDPVMQATTVRRCR